MRFLALDFETSGLDPKRHAPVTLGVALFDGDQVEARVEWIFAPPTNKDGKVTREYDAMALEISGNTLGRIRAKGMAHAVVLRELTDFAREHEAAQLPVVAFNSPFDLAFYSELMFLAGSWDQASRSYKTFKPPLAGPWQCVRMLAAQKLDLDKYSLDAVAAHFGLARSSDSHGAIEDAILAGNVFLALTATEESK